MSLWIYITGAIFFMGLLLQVRHLNHHIEKLERKVDLINYFYVDKLDKRLMEMENQKGYRGK